MTVEAAVHIMGMVLVPTSSTGAVVALSVPLSLCASLAVPVVGELRGMVRIRRGTIATCGR